MLDFFFTKERVNMKMLQILLFLLAVHQCSSKKFALPMGSEAEVVGKYPGFFKTREELDLLNTELTKTWSTNQEASVTARATMFHACCGSNATYRTYTRLYDVEGVLVTLVNFANRQQVFLTETCVTSNTCTCGCGCTIITIIMSAVTLNPRYPLSSPDQLTLSYVKVPSFCRCMNNLPTPRLSPKDDLDQLPSDPVEYTQTEEPQAEDEPETDVKNEL
ncbi:uncharacterized protein LOC131944070 isoform X4 [Physella acuta]|uniref:uncharacterized protein LOC131944070 isoform X4 n=1 Tax=Physella acuta TaxID=109671 RepID=UPI0027DD77B4|nr:uncharacterized protein LOC131944070 isoform X4 [Physella acuta]